MKMNLIYIAFFIVYASCSITRSANGQNCQKITQLSGEIYDYTSRDYDENKCWFLEVPPNSYVRTELKELHTEGYSCLSVYLELFVNAENKTYRFCDKEYGDLTSLTSIYDVNITFVYFTRRTYFRLSFITESVTCIHKNHFRCSSYQCILSEQVCDGVEDCENGLDESECGISSVNSTKESRIKAINWLMNQQKNHGWGRNTHRAVTALYLTNAAKFLGHDATEEAIVNQLQLKAAALLLRNLTEPMSIHELSMYVNALMVTCHDVRNIFSRDLLKILASRAFSSSPVSPGAYLTLCNANWQFSKRNVHQLLNLLIKNIDYPFAFEIQAMTIMALSCLNEKTSLLHNINNASSIYNETIQNFMLNQKRDGSFGNAHTTAMVTQALISSGQIENRQWSVVNATFSLVKSLNTSSVDFLTVYLTLPLLKGKTLVDIDNEHCSNYKRKLEDDEDILDVADKLGEKIHVQYSLHIGDNKNIINNLYLKVPENSTAYDVMKIAQIADPKYKFSYHETNGRLYIYGIAGLTNDMEAGKVWLLYIVRRNDTKLIHYTQSPDQIIMNDKDHLIMWYKFASV